jgi:hypothetical protein
MGNFRGGCNSPSATKIFLPTLKPIVTSVIVIIVVVVVVVVIVVASGLGVTLPHTNITTNSNSAALISNGLAKLCALHETGELFSAENHEGVSLDLHAEVNAWWKIAIGRLNVEVLLLLGGLEQAEGQTIQALMANGKIGENEVAGFSWAIEVGHTGGGYTGEDRWVVGSGGRDTAMCKRTSMLQTGIEKEIGVVVKCDVFAFFDSGAFDNSELDNWRRINGSTVAVGCRKVSTSKKSARILMPGASHLA